MSFTSNHGRPWYLWAILWLGMSLLAAMGSILRGTTIGPGFKRVEGTLGKWCPFSHPWSIAGRTKCCAQYAPHGDGEGHLDIESPVDLCRSQDWVECDSDHRLCIDHPSITHICPTATPLRCSNVACTSVPYLKSEEPCQEQPTSKESALECCLDPIIVPRCQGGIAHCQGLEALEYLAQVVDTDQIVLLEHVSFKTFRPTELLKNICIPHSEETRWLGTGPDDHFILDLGRLYALKKLTVTPSSDRGLGYRGTKSFEIFLSVRQDPYNWRKVANDTFQKYDPSLWCISDSHVYTFETHVARYFWFQGKSSYGAGHALAFLGFN